MPLVPSAGASVEVVLVVPNRAARALRFSISVSRVLAGRCRAYEGGGSAGSAGAAVEAGSVEIMASAVGGAMASCVMVAGVCSGGAEVEGAGGAASASVDEIRDRGGVFEGGLGESVPLVSAATSASCMRATSSAFLPVVES